MAEQHVDEIYLHRLEDEHFAAHAALDDCGITRLESQSGRTILTLPERIQVLRRQLAESITEKTNLTTRLAEMERRLQSLESRLA